MLFTTQNRSFDLTSCFVQLAEMIYRKIVFPMHNSMLYSRVSSHMNPVVVLVARGGSTNVVNKKDTVHELQTPMA